MDCRCLEFYVGVRCHLAAVLSLEDHAASHFAKGPSIDYVLDMVGRSIKWPVLLTCSSYADIVVVGSEKVHNYSDVIYGWSLTQNIFSLRLKACVDSRASWICEILLRLILKNSISYIYSRVIACNRNFLIRLKKFSIPLKQDENTFTRWKAAI